jgi:glycolate oxidase FAD binding subunit
MLDTLRSVIDGGRVTDDADAFVLHDVKPGALVEPRTAAEAAAVMKLATERKWRVECAGAGTHPFGNRRTRADIVVSTRALNDIVEYEPADLVIGVQAGMTMRTLQKETAQHAQFYAQDPPAHEDSTVGGTIATARSGPLRYAHGTTRDHVLGLQMVTGDGRILQIGGRVVKNVAGYDLVRLVVGSAGTLGLVTSAYLRLKPIPQADATLLIGADQPAALLELTRFIADEHLEAVAIELAGPGALTESWTLLVRLADNPDAVADAGERIRTRSAQLKAEVFDGKREWGVLAQLELDALTVVRIADLPARMDATLQVAQKLMAKLAVPARLIAHAGNGIVRILIGDNTVEETAFAIGEARAVIGMMGGSVLVHSRNAELMRRVDAFAGARPLLPLMTKLKAIFDPAGVLAPGRFVV